MPMFLLNGFDVVRLAKFAVVVELGADDWFPDELGFDVSSLV